ncbi:TPA: hypothetical protein H7W21_001598 [Escherichia coli]|nr:hypothetical protein [Escherichia coli]HAL9821605.1 hypothetical protein [Escherichia coli]
MFHTIVSIKNDGHYFCRAGGNRPDGLNEPVTIKGERYRLKEKRKAVVMTQNATPVSEDEMVKSGQHQ